MDSFLRLVSSRVPLKNNPGHFPGPLMLLRAMNTTPEDDPCLRKEFINAHGGMYNYDDCRPLHIQIISLYLLQLFEHSHDLMTATATDGVATPASQRSIIIDVDTQCASMTDYSVPCVNPGPRDTPTVTLKALVTEVVSGANVAAPATNIW